LILYSSFDIPISILVFGSTMIYMLGIGPGPASFAVVVGVNVGFAITDMILSSNIRRRVVSLQKEREDHCINCGYPYDPDGELCSECGHTRWVDS
jgi:hypothetical protein